MKLRPIDIHILNSVQPTEVKFGRNKQDYTWSEIEVLRHSGWKAVSLERERFTAQSIELLYSIAPRGLPLQSKLETKDSALDPSKLQVSKVTFRLQVLRSKWQKILDSHFPFSDRNESIRNDELPSNKEHPRYKELFERPAGRFMRPIDKQASNLFKRGDRKD